MLSDQFHRLGRAEQESALAALRRELDRFFLLALAASSAAFALAAAARLYPASFARFTRVVALWPASPTQLGPGPAAAQRDL